MGSRRSPWKRRPRPRSRCWRALAARGVLKREQKRLLPETVQHLWVFRSPRYFVVDAKAKRAPEIRLVDALFSEEIPDVRDAALSCLVDACNVLPVLFGEREMERGSTTHRAAAQHGPDRKGDKRRGRRHRAFENPIHGASAGLTLMGGSRFRLFLSARAGSRPPPWPPRRPQARSGEDDAGSFPRQDPESGGGAILRTPRAH